MWLPLSGRARSQAELEPFFARLHSSARHLVRLVLPRTQESGRLAPDEATLTVETEHLAAALIDGLSLGAVTQPTALLQLFSPRY